MSTSSRLAILARLSRMLLYREHIGVLVRSSHHVLDLLQVEDGRLFIGIRDWTRIIIYVHYRGSISSYR